MDIKREERLQQKKDYYYRNRERILTKQKESLQNKFETIPGFRAQHNEKWRVYTKNNYEKRLLSSIKSKCIKYNIEFNLDLSDIIIPEVCPITKIPLVIHKERGKFIDTPSIDRIDPTKGYTKSNIRFVCFWYNVAKLNFTDIEVKNLCKKVMENS